MDRTARTRLWWGWGMLAAALSGALAIAAASAGEKQEDSASKDGQLAREHQAKEQPAAASGNSSNPESAADEGQRRRQLLWTLILRSVGAHPFGNFK